MQSNPVCEISYLKGSQEGTAGIRSEISQNSEIPPNIDHGPFPRIPNVPKSNLFVYIYDMGIGKSDLDPFQPKIISF